MIIIMLIRTRANIEKSAPWCSPVGLCLPGRETVQNTGTFLFSEHGFGEDDLLVLQRQDPTDGLMSVSLCRWWSRPVCAGAKNAKKGEEEHVLPQLAMVKLDGVGLSVLFSSSETQPQDF